MDDNLTPKIELGDLVLPTIETKAAAVRDTAQPHLPEAFPEGAGLAARQAREDAAQLSHRETFRLQTEQSSVNSAIEWAQDLPDAISEWTATGNANLAPYREELTKDIPGWLIEDVMGSRTLVGARARAARIREDNQQQAALAAQKGISKLAVSMGASLFDADLPLMFATGGTVAAARVAHGVSRSALSAGMGAGAARATGKFLTGAAGGAQAGAITGGLELAVRDDRDLGHFMTSVTQAAVMGARYSSYLSRRFDEVDAAMADFEVNLQRQLADPKDPIHNQEPALGQHFGPVTVDLGDTTQSTGQRQGPVTIDLEGDANSMGAAGTGMLQFRTAMKKAGASDSTMQLSDNMYAWRQASDFEKNMREDTSNPLVNLLVGNSHATVPIPGTSKSIPVGQIAGTVFTLAQRDFTDLVFSKSPSANYVAAELLESASGLGRDGSTASVLKEMYHSSAMVNVDRSLGDARAAFFQQRGLNPLKTGSTRAFDRELRLAMNERHMGRQEPKEFTELLDKLDRTHEVVLAQMQGHSEAVSVRGSTAVANRSGWMRYAWNGRKFVDAIDQLGKKEVQNAFALAYQRGSGLKPKLAKKVAKAIVNRMRNKGMGIDAVDSRLLETDNREAIETLLGDSGLTKADVDSVMKAFNSGAQERSKKGYLRDRVDADLSVRIGNSDLTLADLMDDDFERVLQQYVGDASGAAALARKGIRDKADQDRLITSIMTEQAALGDTKLTRPRVEAILSQFSGGTHKGHMWGTTTDGLNPMTSMLTKATRVSLLQRLGLTQMMDTANMFVANGTARALEPMLANIGVGTTMTQPAMRAALADLQSVGVIVGKDHDLFAPHLTVDEGGLAMDALGQGVQQGMGKLDRLNSYVSGQIGVTKVQQEVAAVATSSNLIRYLAGEETNLTERMVRDMGLTTASVRELKGHIKSGKVSITKEGTVDLNAKSWSPELREEFGAAMVRSVNQQVQKSMTGETSVWMNTDVGKILTAIKTFGMVAGQKQMTRQLMIGGNPALVNAAAWQIGFSYAVISLSQAIQGTDMDAVDKARLAVAYTPALGTIPMVVDPMTSMLGFDDYNFSPYGRYSHYLDSPVFETVGKLAQSPGAILDTVTGTGDYQDNQNARAMFFMNWYGMKRVWDEL